MTTTETRIPVCNRRTAGRSELRCRTRVRKMDDSYGDGSMCCYGSERLRKVDRGANQVALSR